MTTQQMPRLQGQTVFDNSGQRIGDVARVFFNQATNEPAWITIRGLGAREAFVPMSGARVDASGVTVPVRKDVIQAAPAVEAGTDLSAEEAAKLDRYYTGMLSLEPELPPAAGPAPQPRPTPPEPQQTPPEPRQTQPTARRTPPAAPTRPTETPRPTELTSFEERVRVGTEAVETGTVRLRKHVVNEPVETSVPLRHEEVTVERVPAATPTPSPGHQFEEQTVEVTLHAERPNIVKETVPVETVRLSTKTETDERRISDQVRRERIEVEDQRSGGAMRRR